MQPSSFAGSSPGEEAAAGGAASLSFGAGIFAAGTLGAGLRLSVVRCAGPFATVTPPIRRLSTNVLSAPIPLPTPAECRRYSLNTNLP
jgi:hypothetical protein